MFAQWHEKISQKYRTRKLSDGQNVSPPPPPSQQFSRKTAASHTEQCTSPSLFHNFEVSWGSSNWSLLNYGVIYTAISLIIVRMCTKHLAMKRNHYPSLEIRSVCMEMGSCLSGFVNPHWLSAGTQWFFSPYCIHLLRKPVKTNVLLLCERWQTSPQTCTTKKVT